MNINILKRLLKILRNTALVLVGLLILVALLVNFTPVQNFVARKAAGILADKLQTTVRLDKVRIDFLNHVVIQGLYIEDKKKDTLAYIGEARVRITDWFFLKKGTPVLKYVGLKNTYAHLYRTAQSGDWNYQFIVDAFDTDTKPKKKKKSGNDFEIDLDKVALENVRFHMDDAWVGSDMDFDVGNAVIVADDVNFKKKIIDLEKISLERVAIQLRDYDGGRPPRPRKKRSIDTTAFNPDKWIVKLSDLNLKDCFFGLESSTKPAIAGEFDASHLRISKINIDADDIIIKGDTLTGDLNNLSAMERCGLIVKKFKAKVSVSPNASICKNLYLQTGHSKLERYYAMHYTRFPDFQDYIHKVVMVADLKNAVIDSRDVAVFAPELKHYPTIINISGKAKGTVDNINAQQLNLTDGISTVKGNLIMKGLPDINTTFIDYKNGELVTNAKGIFKYAPSLKNNKDIAIEKLSMVYFKGDFTGYINNFATNSVLVTNLGVVRSNVKLNLPGMKSRAAIYSGTMATESFNLGALLNQPDLGTISMNAKVKGNSFDPAIAQIKVNSTVSHIEYKGYRYQNITLDGSIEKNKFDGNMLIDDPNLALAFYGNIDFSQQLVNVNAKANLLKSNFAALKLTKDSITATADFDLNCTGSDIDNFSGFAKLYNINLIRNGHRLDIDSVYVNSSKEGEDKLLTVESNILTARIKGDYRLSKLGNSIQYYVSGYLPEYIRKPTGEAPQQRFSFDVKTNDIDSLLGVAITGIKGFNNATITGSLNTTEQSFGLVGNIPYGRINNITLRDVNITGSGNFKTLTLVGNAREVVLGDSILTGAININTSLGNDELDFKIATTTSDKYGTATLNGKAIARGDSLTVTMQPSEFFLNDTKWEIQSAAFTVATKYLFVNNFVLTSGTQRITASSARESNSASTVLTTELNNLDVAQIANIAGMQDYKADGHINGFIRVKDVMGDMYITTDIKATDVKFGLDTLGNVNISGNYDAAKKLIHLDDVSGIYRGNSSITTSGNMSFDSNNREKLSGLVQLNNAPLSWLNPVLTGYVSNISGNLNGDIKITGSAAYPDVDGYIKMSDAGMRIDFLGPYYKVPMAYIKLNNSNIDIGQFVLHDINDNVATLTGGIKHKRFRDMEFDLNMKSSKLQVINLQEGESELFYGDLVASIRSLDITGPFKDISIDIRGAEPVEKSHVYLPLSSNSGTGTYSYVTFKNYGKPQQVKRKSKNKLSVHIETIMKELAEISLVLDPATGDAINAKGTGRLTIDIPSGNEMRMNGKYTVAEGDYTFTLKDLFFKRNFKLDEGSVIFFNGPIEKTLLDVQGIYSARARLYDLLSNAEKKAFESLGSVKEKNETKAQQTVNVRLFMKGSMGSPQLKFKLEIPDKSSMGTTAYNKLQTINQDDYKLNNQVASLLLFGNFISDDGNITDNAGSGSLSSVSQVFSGQVSSQLSNAVSKLTGDESLRIDVNYNNYNLTNTESSLGTNNRSEVSLGVKKNLFRNSLNDRLVLEVGSKYDWGKASSTSNSSNFNPVGDFRLQYQFREQGTLRGYLFRTSSYDVIGDRNVSRGGIGLSWSRSFNYLGDFFRSQKYINRKRLEEEEKIKADENESGTR